MEKKNDATSFRCENAAANDTSVRKVRLSRLKKLLEANIERDGCQLGEFVQGANIFH